MNNGGAWMILGLLAIGCSGTSSKTGTHSTGGATGNGGASSVGGASDNGGASIGGASGSGGTNSVGGTSTSSTLTVPDSCDAPAFAADVSSPNSVVGSGGGTCNEAALDAALALGGIITFNCGSSDATITVTGPKQIAKDTVIDGGSKVTISGGGKQRIFVVNGAFNFTVQNITLADAFLNGARGNGPSSANSGAAIYRQSESTLRVINTSFKNNHATDAGADIGGGAIYSYGGDTVIVGSTFDGNTGASGGAIGNLRSNLTIVNSVFVNNVARDQMGGAIATDGQNQNHGKVLTLCGLIVKGNQAQLEGGGLYRYGYPDEQTVINLCTFDGNSAVSQTEGLAGGLYVHTDTAGAMPLTMTNSTVSNNTSGNGAGGMFIYQAPFTLTNVTIANNTATHSLGGGIAANGAPGTLRNCTIAGNHADASDSFGGGIIGGSGITLVNSIVANNTAGNAWNPVNCTDACAAGDHDLQYPAKRSSGQDDNVCVTGITFADPLLGSLADNGGTTQTLALLASSPAIGAGANCPDQDQRGHARTGRCDIGAYQYDGP
jgi:hypothetical protein